MATTAITLNGTSFAKCKNVQEEDVGFGVAFQSANSNRRYARRGRKRKFAIAFEGLSITELNAVRTIQGLTASFAYVNGHGTSYTVINMGDPLASSVTEIDTASDAWYDATLTVYEV